MQVNWEVFTPEEKVHIEQALAMGQKENLACLVENMTQEKEKELQTLTDSIKPLISLEENVAQKKFYKENPSGPQSPEEEATLQMAMDTEIKANYEKLQKKNEEKLNSKPVVAIKFCEFCSARGPIKHLNSCTKNKVPVLIPA